jgi:hypothetical protein
VDFLLALLLLGSLGGGLFADNRSKWEKIRDSVVSWFLGLLVLGVFAAGLYEIGSVGYRCISRHVTIR